MRADLLTHLAVFAGALREAGIRVTTGDEVDALRALVLADLGDPEDVRLALRCTLKVRPRDERTFEMLFTRLWLGRAGERTAGRPLGENGPGHPRSPLEAGPSGLAGHERKVEEPEGEERGASREALLRRKSFDRWDERDCLLLERLMARLASRLATRRGRRLRPVHGRGRVDPRRSLRRALATLGEVVTFAKREHPVETARLVVICDTSGSMDGQGRFLLAFVRALKRVARSTEVFVFNTELVRVTSLLSAGEEQAALSALARAVPDWSGGTRIGESLMAFASRHLSELVDSRTVVLIFSDGLERGDPEILAEAMRCIRARARRVIWLNPLLSDPRYEPSARGMAAALPFIDRLAPAHDLESLERLVPHLSL